MRYYYDFEFRDDGKSISPISVGVVAEDGREYYAVWDNALDVCRRDQWLMENVAPQLPLDPEDSRFLDKASTSVRSRGEIRDSIYEFFTETGDSVELWGWFVAYDHLCLSQIWGRMIKVPDPIPQFSNDIRSLMNWYGIKKTPAQVAGNHNALADARHNKVVFDYINEEIRNGW